MWKDEILKWIPTIRDEDINLVKTGKDALKSVPITIMSYDLASKRSEEVSSKKYMVCIADEAHYLKNRDAKRSKNLMPILSASKRVLLLSGTPMLNRPVEMYNLLKILRPDIIGGFNEYAKRYCDPKET